MMFSVEIVPRGKEYAVTETIVYDGREPEAWNDDDVAAVIKEILRAIDRAIHPAGEERPITLRGFSWIVEPSDDQVVIAVELPSGAAVAGPFDIEQKRLDEMMTRVIRTAGSSLPGSSTVH